MKRLCAGCPLRDSKVAETYDSLLDNDAYDLEVAEDAARVEGHPDAAQLRAALGETGTKRCSSLAEVLPSGPQRRKRAIQALSCPEFRLITHLMTPEDALSFSEFKEATSIQN